VAASSRSRRPSSAASGHSSRGAEPRTRRSAGRRRRPPRARLGRGPPAFGRSGGARQRGSATLADPPAGRRAPTAGPPPPTPPGQRPCSRCVTLLFGQRLERCDEVPGRVSPGLRVGMNQDHILHGATPLEVAAGWLLHPRRRSQTARIDILAELFVAARRRRPRRLRDVEAHPGVIGARIVRVVPRTPAPAFESVRPRFAAPPRTLEQSFLVDHDLSLEDRRAVPHVRVRGDLTAPPWTFGLRG
jgi:hypothetical protein